MRWLRGRCYGSDDLPRRWVLLAVAVGLLEAVLLVPWVPVR